MRRRLATTFTVLAVGAGAAAAAQASAPPVGPLPKGVLTTIHVQHGQLFALVVPRPKTGYAWRGARQIDVTVARPLDEAEVNGNIVFVYRAGKRGTTTVVYALTKDEQQKAYAARYFRIVVV
jgi:predicted secreted protein